MDEIGAKTKNLGAKQDEKDLFVINYRFQGVAEKKPETPETVLARRIKVRVRSEKSALLDLSVKGGIFPRGYEQRLQDTCKDLSIKAFLKGLCVKSSFIFFLRTYGRNGQGSLLAKISGEQGLARCSGGETKR
jgi:hypothetical protein